MMIPI